MFPKIGKINTTQIAITAIIGGVAWYLFGRTLKATADVVNTVTEGVSGAVTAVKENPNLINPISDENVANKAAVSVWQATTGSNQSIGEDVYDWIHSTNGIPEDITDTVNYAVDKWGYEKAVELLAKQGINKEVIDKVLEKPFWKIW